MSRRGVVAGLLAVTLVGGCGLEQQPFAVGTLERDRIELAADSSEPIVDIRVTEGDRVVAGDVLLSQDAALVTARLEAARARRDEAAARLAEARTGPRSQSIAGAEARLAGARSAAATALAELRRLQALEADHYATRNQLDVQQGRYEEARAAEQEARAALDELQEGTRSEVIVQARQAVQAAEAQIRELEIGLRRASVSAPVAGMVEGLPLERGERPRAGQTVAVLRADGPTYARVYIPEPLRTRVSVGTPAQVRIDGQAGARPARVRWVATEAAFTPYYALTQRDRSRLAYLAEVELTERDAAELPVGVPVEVRFPDLGP